MTRPHDTISEADLHAYVDNQLTPMRRTAVEDYLSRHPQLAARVMADLHSREELRLALADEPSIVRIETQQLSRRLEAALARDVYLARFRRAAGIAALIAVGWLAHVEFMSMNGWTGASAKPAYVEEAARAHQTALLRASMQSQSVQPNYDRAEIQATTSIKVPDLPRDWQVLDVQIFPSSVGPAVEMAILSKNLGRLSLFAVRPGDFDVMPATVTSSSDVTMSYWQTGDVAYALVGAAEGNALNEAAIQLAATLY